MKYYWADWGKWETVWEQSFNSRADDKNLEQLGKEGQVTRTRGKGVMGPVTHTR